MWYTWKDSIKGRHHSVSHADVLLLSVASTTDHDASVLLWLPIGLSPYSTKPIGPYKCRNLCYHIHEMQRSLLTHDKLQEVVHMSF